MSIGKGGRRRRGVRWEVWECRGVKGEEKVGQMGGM